MHAGSMFWTSRSMRRENAASWWCELCAITDQSTRWLPCETADCTMSLIHVMTACCESKEMMKAAAVL